MPIDLASDQIIKFHHYHSLDFQNKPYQEKAFLWAKNLTLNTPKILELGAADGSFLKYVSTKLHGQPQGLDITGSGQMVKAHDFKDSLPQPDNTFDLVFALEVIEHLYDTDAFLSDIYRVLKPNGYLILSTPNLASLSNRLKLIFGKYPKYLEYSTAGAGHIHLYTHQVLANQILSTGFKLKKLSSVNPPNPFITKSWYPKKLREISLALGDIFPSIGSHLLALAKK